MSGLSPSAQAPSPVIAPLRRPDLAAEAERIDEWIREREAKTESRRLQAKAERQRLRKQLAEEREAAASRAAALEPKIPIPPGFIALRWLAALFFSLDVILSFQNAIVIVAMLSGRLQPAVRSAKRWKRTE